MVKAPRPPEQPMSGPCLLCKREGQPDSGEHIIPASLGGALNVWGLICRECNSTRGSDTDAVLEKTFRELLILFGIRHQRTGRIKDLISEVDGRKMRYDYDRNVSTHAHPSAPEISTNEYGGITWRMRLPTGDEKEVAEQIERVRASFLKRYPDVKPEQIFVKPQKVVEPAPASTFEFLIDLNPGSEFNRAVHKIAFTGAAHLLGKAPFAGSEFDEVRAVIRGEATAPLIVFPEGSVLLRPPLHGITLHPQDGELLVLVSLLGGFQVAVRLGRWPEDQPVPPRGLIFDPQQHEVAFLETLDQVLGASDYDQLAPRLQIIRNAANFDLRVHQIVHAAWQESGFTEIPPGIQPSPEMLEKLSQSVAFKAVLLLQTGEVE